MLKIVIAIVFVAWVVSSIVRGHEREEAQDQRTAAQVTVLTTLEGLHDSGVSSLVDEWRTAHPEPSQDELTELRLLAERVKADPASARRYTAQAKQAYVNALPFKPVIGDWGTQKPGLDGAVPAAEAASPPAH